MPVLRLLRWREMVRETNLTGGKLMRMQGKEQGTISGGIPIRVVPFYTSYGMLQLHLFSSTRNVLKV